MMKKKFKNITVIKDIEKFTGSIPVGSELVVFDGVDPNSAIVLYGFDEVGIFDNEFTSPPVYGIYK